MTFPRSDPNDLSRAFTGQVRLGEDAASVRGTFGAGRTAVVNMQFPTLGVATLQLDLAADGATIVGSVNLEASLSTFTARRTPNVPAGSAKPKPRYTALLLPAAQPSAPRGTGYALIRFGRNGDAVLTGRTADGQPFSASAELVADGTLPVFARIKSESTFAALVGEIGFASETNAAVCSGALIWRPLRGGETGDLSLDVIGSVYSAPAPSQWPLRLPRAVVRFGFDKPLAKGVKVFASGELIPESRGRDALRLVINPATGGFGGFGTEPATGARHIVRGVILQQQRRGGGFAGKANVTLEPR